MKYFGDKVFESYGQLPSRSTHGIHFIHARVVHVREIADVKIYWKHAWLGISYVIDLSNSECICSLKFIKAKEDIKNMPFNFLVFFPGVKYWI